ncbi:MAG: GatB/YqeY domain-containing protein [Gemmatimonadales bacterium]|jgi:uncharacterized protein YqeY|nr:GatB/YqeY domain-containing protein [Gemmatimonadales bacterium]
MSDVTQALQAALNAARKAQNKDRTLVVGTVLSAVRARALDAASPLSHDDELDVLRKQVKLRRDAALQYEQARRPDLAAVELAQVAVIQEFLPPDVSPDEIRAAVRAAIASGATDVGKVMAQVMPALKGRAEGKVINQVVREELARP